MRTELGLAMVPSTLLSLSFPRQKATSKSMRPGVSVDPSFFGKVPAIMLIIGLRDMPNSANTSCCSSCDLGSILLLMMSQPSSTIFTMEVPL